jgi:HAD domain in Swiss Army Knife RNA repair proteins
MRRIRTRSAPHTRRTAGFGAPPAHQNEPRIYVFLDFDGVMRRLSSQPFKFDADCRERFENVLRDHPHARVVIASVWRLGLSLDALRKMFSPDIAPRVVGVTPEAPGFIKHYRLREVLGYLKRHGAADAQWVIIDDNRAQYPEGVKVIPTEPQKGFDARAAEALSTELQMPAPAQTEARHGGAYA